MTWAAPSERILNDSAPLRLVLLCFSLAIVSFPCRAQDLQPRRWSHLPIDSNFTGGGYAYADGGVAFDPVLLIDDVSMEMHTLPLQYIRTFEWAGRTARVDFLQAYQDAEWNGQVDGVSTRVTRSGFSDSVVRFAMNVIGSPPLSGTEYTEYRAAMERDTIVGLALELQLPTGQYFNDKLLNLGTNRFTFRPQLGMVHRRGKWSGELTASTWLYTDNDDFFNGNYLEQAPLYTLQLFADHTLQPGLWIGGGIAYGMGAESTLNGIHKDDPRDAILWGLSFGYPIWKQIGGQVSYLSQRTQTSVGADWDSILATVSMRW